MSAETDLQARANAIIEEYRGDKVADVVAGLSFEIARLKEALEGALNIASGDLDFTPPLVFQFEQGSDETGERYTRVARFVDARGHVMIDLADGYGGDWVDTQMHAIAALLTIARRAALGAQEQAPEESST